MSVFNLIIILCLSLTIINCSKQVSGPSSKTSTLILKADNSDSNQTLKQKVTRNIADFVIKETYLDLYKESENLYKSVLSLSKDRSNEKLALAQEAWRKARRPWEASESFLFGPVESLGIDPLIDTWPINLVDINSIVNSNKVINKKFVQGLGTNVIGFHSIEYLLFGDGKSKVKKTIAEFKERDFDYLISISQLFTEHTFKLKFAWEQHQNPDDLSSLAFVVVLMNPGLDNSLYPSVNSVLSEYVQGMINIVDEVANGKLSGPMGSNISSADVSKVESPYSWNSIEDFYQNVMSIKSIYTGDYKEHLGPGIDEIIAKLDPQLDQRIKKEINNCLNSITNIGEYGKVSFRQAILDQGKRKQILAAIEDLHILFQSLETDVIKLINK